MIIITLVIVRMQSWISLHDHKNTLCISRSVEIFNTDKSSVAMYHIPIPCCSSKFSSYLPSFLWFAWTGWFLNVYQICVFLFCKHFKVLCLRGYGRWLFFFSSIYINHLHHYILHQRPWQSHLTLMIFSIIVLYFTSLYRSEKNTHILFLYYNLFWRIPSGQLKFYISSPSKSE